MERRIRARLSASEGRKFAFTVGIAFLALSGITLWRGHRTVFTILSGIGLVLILAGLVAPTRLGPIYRGWMALALAISKVTTPIFMGIIYYLVLTPTGLIMRLIGRNPLRREADENGYWIVSGDGKGVSDMNRQF